MELFEHCRGCARYLRSCSGMSKEVCEQHNLRVPRVPITNADRIRSMTDEELAYRLAINECGICPLKEKCFAMQPIKDCEDMWLDWLRQEATDDEQS